MEQEIVRLEFFVVINHKSFFICTGIQPSTLVLWKSPALYTIRHIRVPG